MTSARSNLNFILFVDGVLILVLSAAMLVAMALDLAMGNLDWQAFAMSAGTTAFVGGALTLACRGQEFRLQQRAGYLLTVSAWLVVGAFASLPLYLSTLELSYTDAFFETISGLTTTGSTVIVGLDNCHLAMLDMSYHPKTYLLILLSCLPSVATKRHMRERDTCKTSLVFVHAR